MNKREMLARANHIYDQESDYVEGLLASDATWVNLLRRVEALEKRLAGNDQAAAAELAQARALLLEMTREYLFKLGYLFAHEYPPDGPADLK